MLGIGFKPREVIEKNYNYKVEKGLGYFGFFDKSNPKTITFSLEDNKFLYFLNFDKLGSREMYSINKENSSRCGIIMYEGLINKIKRFIDSGSSLPRLVELVNEETFFISKKNVKKILEKDDETSKKFKLKNIKYIRM